MSQFLVTGISPDDNGESINSPIPDEPLTTKPNVDHVWHQGCSMDVDVPCYVCSVELSLCIACGGAEGSLPTSCPGKQMTREQLDDVYAGKTDFRNGKWIDAHSIHAPGFRHKEELQTW